MRALPFVGNFRTNSRRLCRGPCRCLLVANFPQAQTFRSVRPAASSPAPAPSRPRALVVAARPCKPASARVVSAVVGTTWFLRTNDAKCAACKGGKSAGFRPGELATTRSRRWRAKHRSTIVLNNCCCWIAQHSFMPLYTPSRKVPQSPSESRYGYRNARSNE